MDLSDSDNSVLPDEAPAAAPVPVSLAASLVRKTGRPLCSSELNIKRRENYAERKLVKKAKVTGKDEYWAAAMRTSEGRRQMPQLYKNFGRGVEFQTMVKNTMRILESMGGRHKQEVAHMLCTGLPAKWVVDELGLTRNQVKRAQENIELVSGRSITEAVYAENISRDKTPEGLAHVYKHFYSRSTYQCSGAVQEKARIMDMEYYEWEAQLHAEWPTLLRELAAAHPHLVPKADAMPKTGWTEFDASLLAAIHQVPDDPAAAKKQLRLDFLETYCNSLARKNGCLPPVSDAVKDEVAQARRDRTASRLNVATFDPATYTIIAPQLRSFRKWLVAEGLRYTRFSVPHPCPLCTKGPTDEVVFVAVNLEISTLVAAGSPVPAELSQKSNTLRKSLTMYRLHLQQLAKARAEAKKTEDNLKPGECMVIRDFVNHHDHGGKHVKCLHWVLMWRETVGGPIFRLKLRHYCSDKRSMSTDSYYQADVTDFHLNEENPLCPRLFEDFHTIYFVGDHGPHFSSHDTMHNESTLFRRFGKKIILMFLASYHAYSRADASGSEDSTALRRDLRVGLPRFGAAALSEMTNSSHDVRSWAYTFPCINRNENVFPEEKQYDAPDRALWIKKWCEVKFEPNTKEPLHDGVLQYRMVTGEGVWKWTDLIAASRAPGVRMCDSCSTKQNTIVYHTHDECPAPERTHVLPTFIDLQPDPARISGKQVARRKGPKAKAVTYPCKYDACDRKNRKAFRKPENANVHMRKEHKPTDEEFTAMMYPVDPATILAKQARGRPKGKKQPAAAAVAASEDISISEPAQSVGDQEHKTRAREGQGSSDDEQSESSHPDEDESEEPQTEDSPSDSESDCDELGGAGEETFEVKAILKHVSRRTGIKYYVDWAVGGTPTWEPASSMTPGYVAAYHKKDNAKRAIMAAEKAAAKHAREAAVKAKGGSVRPARAHKSVHDSDAERVGHVTTVAEYYEADGMNWAAAYERAQLEVPW